MDIVTMKEIAQKMMSNRKAHLGREKGFIYYHGERVAKLSLTLRKYILPDDTSHDNIMMVASWFHDVAKGIEPHGQYGAILVKDILKGYCSADELEEIAEIVHHHPLRKQKDDYSEYLKMVQDADILDHYGTIEIWMNFMYYAYKDQTIEDSLEFYRDHFDSQAKESRELLNYELSRRIFDDKIDFVHSFVKRFEKEGQGEFSFFPF